MYANNPRARITRAKNPTVSCGTFGQYGDLSWKTWNEKLWHEATLSKLGEPAHVTLYRMLGPHHPCCERCRRQGPPMDIFGSTQCPYLRFVPISRFVSFLPREAPSSGDHASCIRFRLLQPSLNLPRAVRLVRPHESVIAGSLSDHLAVVATLGHRKRTRRACTGGGSIVVGNVILRYPGGMSTGRIPSEIVERQAQHGRVAGRTLTRLQPIRASSSRPGVASAPRRPLIWPSSTS